MILVATAGLMLILIDSDSVVSTVGLMVILIDLVVRGFGGAVDDDIN